MTTRVRFFDRARFEQICPGQAPSVVRQQIDAIKSPRQELWKAEVTCARVLEAVDRYARLALLYYALGCESNVRSCHRIMIGLVRQYLPGEAWRLYLHSVGRKKNLEFYLTYFSGLHRVAFTKGDRLMSNAQKLVTSPLRVREVCEILRCRYGIWAKVTDFQSGYFETNADLNDVHDVEIAIIKRHKQKLVD